MPTKTFFIFSSIIDWAWSTAFCMASVVASIFTTIPLFNPLEGYEPKATISSSCLSLYFPTIQTTLDVPISNPTIKFEFFELFAIF